METIPIDYTRILEEIQINSYNLDQKFLKLNQQLLTDTTTESAITIQGSIQKIHNNLNLLTAILIVYIVLQLIKLRIEKK